MIFWISCIIYLLVFSVATVFFYLSDSAQKRYGKMIFAFMGILVLSLFAASRSDEIGKDIQGYVLPIFNIAKSSSSFNEFISMGQNFTDASSSSSKEWTYLLLTYLCSKVSVTDSFLLFMLQFLTVTPVYLSAVQFSKRYKISIPFYMLTYMFIFYLNSFNIMRQSIACAFFLLGFSYEKNNKWKMLICYGVAILFHRMAFIAIILLLLGKCLSHLKKYKRILFLVIILFIPFVIRPLLLFLMNMNLLTAAQNYYANVFIFGTIATEWTNVSVLLLLIDVTRRTLMIIPYFSIKSTEAYMYELKNVVLVGYILYMEFLLMTHSVYGGRISLFTDFLIMPLWAYFVKKKFKPAIYGYAIIVLIMLILWLIWDLKINNYGIFRFRF